MEKARDILESKSGASGTMAQLPISQHKPYQTTSFFEGLVLRGIKVKQTEPGFVSCTFKVPPYLTDATWNLSSGAIASLVDEVGAAAVHEAGQPMKVSVDMSISYMSNAKIDDELEIVSRMLGQKGRYYGTCVLLRNKTTGEIIAEGRLSLYGSKPNSKM